MPDLTDEALRRDTMAAWQDAKPGDTPGELVPGEGDITPEPQADPRDGQPCAANVDTATVDGADLRDVVAQAIADARDDEGDDHDAAGYVLAALTAAGWPDSYQPDNPHVAAPATVDGHAAFTPAALTDARNVADAVREFADANYLRGLPMGVHYAPDLINRLAAEVERLREDRTQLRPQLARAQADADEARRERDEANRHREQQAETIRRQGDTIRDYTRALNKAQADELAERERADNLARAVERLRSGVRALKAHATQERAGWDADAQHPNSVPAAVLTDIIDRLAFLLADQPETAASPASATVAYEPAVRGRKVRYRLWLHECGHVDEWLDGTEPLEDSGCDACESGGGRWRPLFVPASPASSPTADPAPAVDLMAALRASLEAAKARRLSADPATPECTCYSGQFGKPHEQGCAALTDATETGAGQ